MKKKKFKISTFDVVLTIIIAPNNCSLNLCNAFHLWYLTSFHNNLIRKALLSQFCT